MSFPLFGEKILYEDIKFISWCPTTDLVLFVSPLNHLFLYRNGVDLVWSVEDQIDSDIRVTTWNPNGKEFVLGCEDGTVYKVDIRYHSPSISPCWHETNPEKNVPITSLVWTNYNYNKSQMKIEGFDSNAFDLESALPLLSNERPLEPLSRFLLPKNKRPNLPNKPVKHSDTQTLLFIGDQNGRVHTLLSGIYPICHISLKEYDKDSSIIDISIAQSTSSLQILTKSAANEFRFYTINTEFLDQRKEEIFSISERQAQLNYLLQYTEFSTQVLKRHYDSYTAFSRRIAAMAAENITNHNEEANAMPEVDLIGTLATGNVTESLQEFFTDFLTPQKIKEWESTMTHGYQNSLVTACQYVLPACDRIQLELSKLLGYSLWTQRYGDFLETSSVETCIECIQQFVRQMLDYTKSLNILTKSFEAFIQWISAVSQKISAADSVEFENQSSLCEEPELVLTYLDTNFVKDYMAPYFISTEQQKSLIERLSDLSICCEKMLKKPSKIFSTKICVASISSFTLDGILLQNQPKQKIVSITSPTKQTIFYALVQLSPKPSLIVLRKEIKHSIMQYTSLITTGPITDFEFFDDKELSILVEGQDETYLQTVFLDRLEFKNLTGDELVSDSLEPVRVQTLRSMLDVKIGCNGRERRRIFCVIASNGYSKVLSMDEEEEGE